MSLSLQSCYNFNLGQVLVSEVFLCVKILNFLVVICIGYPFLSFSKNMYCFGLVVSGETGIIL